MLESQQLGDSLRNALLGFDGCLVRVLALLFVRSSVGGGGFNGVLADTNDSAGREEKRFAGAQRYDLRKQLHLGARVRWGIIEKIRFVSLDAATAFVQRRCASQVSLQRAKPVRRRESVHYRHRAQV